jgi:hypothetical protein
MDYVEDDRFSKSASAQKATSRKGSHYGALVLARREDGTTWTGADANGSADGGLQDAEIMHPGATPPPSPKEVPSWVTKLSDSGRLITNLEFEFWAATLEEA